MLPLPPTVALAQRPTPIEPLPRLSAELGIELYVKRDDLTGSALSGNKVRKLEFLLADAKRQGRNWILTCGWAHSNHCRATAVAARQLGLECTVFLRGSSDDPPDGNRLLARWVGAEMIFLDPVEYADVGARMRAECELRRETGRDGYVIPGGGSNALGALGYVECAHEIATWKRLRDLTFDSIVFASGSGGTQAGLMAGAHLYGLTARIEGVVDDDYEGLFPAKVAGILAEMREQFWPELNFEEDQVQLLEGHWGEGYGQSTPEELQFIVDTARLDGLLLDPVYTVKALRGLIERAQQGHFARGARVLFIHTGGIWGVTPEHLMPYL